VINIKVSAPYKLEISGLQDAHIERLKKELSYTDKKSVQLYNRFKNNRFWALKLDPEEYHERLCTLRKAQVKTLVFEKSGKVFTYSGLLDRVLKVLNGEQVNVEPWSNYPEPKGLAYDSKPVELREYQKEALQALIANPHSAVSMATGSGKTPIIAALIAHYGLGTTVIVPSNSIADQMYLSFVRLFGKKHVGLIGDGKKDYKKLITIGIDKSLIRLKKDSDMWQKLEQNQVVICDESHLSPVETQEEVLTKLLANAPYRHFLSATQFRNDGSDILLEGLIGRIVYDYPISRGVKEGFLAKPRFYIKKVQAGFTPTTNDPLQILTQCFYENKEIHKDAAELANNLIDDYDKPVMIMIDRIEQFRHLLPYLKYKPEFCFGSLTKEQKKFVPLDYHKSDKNDIIKRFNNGEIKLIVGTPAVGMGTDSQPVFSIINLQGGQSKNKITQLVGRGTRRVPGKEYFNFFDYDVDDIDILHHWAISRVKLYKTLSNFLKYLN
jgi:superfamily II DNA or RNA helicase